MYKKYFQLTKPGIIIGNSVTGIAGFFLASRGHINFMLLIAFLAGMSLVIASACVFNNILDRKIDKKMQRTKHRAIASGKISIRSALIYGTVLGTLGFGILFTFTNITTVAVGMLGFFFYEVMYGIWKRLSPISTIIGSVAGATPPVAGYTAVTGRVDLAAILLFLILVFWQMPHFYSIGMFRLSDYKKAHIPVWPVSKGMRSTKIQVLLFIVGFGVCTALLSAFGYVGKFYFYTMFLVTIFWITLALMGFLVKGEKLWARQMFFASLAVNLIFGLTLIISSVLGI